MISQQNKSTTVTIFAASEDHNSQEYSLGHSEGVFVGRSGNCGLKLPDAGIADIHCRIEFEAGKLWIQDWMSNGGTRVNGEPIWTKIEVHQRDKIQIGKHVITFAELQPDAMPIEEPTVSEIEPQNIGDFVADQPEEVFGSDEKVFDFDADFLDAEEETSYDGETVAILQAEIEELRSELAHRDACQSIESTSNEVIGPLDQTDDVLSRMQELIDEADRSDERVAILEEMLHAAEDANRAEQEERHHLESWVGDIENRLGQREDEHQAELDVLRNRFDDSQSQREQLQKKLRQAASGDNAQREYQESIEQLQKANDELQESLAETQMQNLSLQQKIEQSGDRQDQLLREERANIAKEQAKVSRLRYELTEKLSAIEELPKSENRADQETSQRIQALRQHLREIHDQEKIEEREAPLTKRLARLWKRMDAN